MQLKPNRVWRTYLGGKSLDLIEGKRNPEDSHFPEDWIASDTRALNVGRENVTEGLSKVIIDGIEFYLKDLIEENPIEMLGESHIKQFGHTTQILLKLLDSSIRLHIQCHPTIEFAKKHLNSNHGKTEAYYIISVRENIKKPYIYLGFQNPPTPSELKETIKNQDVKKLKGYFKKIPVRPGDSFLVPGGLPHAIGKGIFMIEIMEPSDFCVRIEFERGGYTLPKKSRFMNRGLDFALSLFNYEKITREEVLKKFFFKPELINSKETDLKEYSLIEDCFRLNKVVIKKKAIICKDSFYIGIVVKGSGRLNGTNNWLDIHFGEKFFIPFKTEKIIIEAIEPLEIILALPPRKTSLKIE